MLAGAIVLLLILAITIPALIKGIQGESEWTVKQTRSTRAFQLAEAGIERGYQQLILSTGTWTVVQAGGTVRNFNFDRVYSGLGGGQYEIRIAQGPGTDAATITSVGRDNSSEEI